MTNAEKYKKVFGMEVDPSICPTIDCSMCPCKCECINETHEWWYEEYKGDT